LTFRLQKNRLEGLLKGLRHRPCAGHSIFRESPPNMLYHTFFRFSAVLGTTIYDYLVLYP